MNMSQDTKNDVLYDEKYLYTAEERAASPLPPPSPRRLSGESSGSGSEYYEDMKAELASAKKAYTFYNTKSHFNMRVMDANGNCLFYVDNSSFTPGKPDVTLCCGSEKTGKIAGVVRWSSMYSKRLTIGVGGGDGPDTNWEDMKTEHFVHPSFKWYIDVDGSGKRHEFMWQRLHLGESKAEGVNSWSTKNFKLIDTETGAVVAAFASNRFKSWKKIGKLTYNADFGEKWELMTLISVLGIIEMSRRRGRARRSGGGHGGP